MNISAPFRYKLKTQCKKYNASLYRFHNDTIAFAFPIAYDLTYYGYRIRINEELSPNRSDVPRDRWVSEEELNAFNEKYPALPRLQVMFPDIDVMRRVGEDRIKLTDSCYILHVNYFTNTTRTHYAGNDGLLCITDYTEDTIDILNTFERYFNHPTYTWLINNSRMRNYTMLISTFNFISMNISGFSKFVEAYTNEEIEFHDRYTDRATDPINIECIKFSIATDPIEPEPITEQPKRVTWRWSI